ncbi:hypothetical protein [Paenibacillus sp. GCM10012306]|uniref:hypothetical protein n=1 Tax=Paenibacillus sp. GCM10012306 TaxID=3317342 RepID=UPI003614A15A
MQQQSKLKALFINIFPGAGHYYMGRRTSGIIYFLVSFGGLFLSILLAMASRKDEIALLGLAGFIVIWLLSMVHLLIQMLKEPTPPIALPLDEPRGLQYTPPVKSEDNERFHIILLSFIPGLGHFHMGLMKRGLSFLISFFGFITILLFLAGITSSNAFLLFFGVLPVIWLYCMFDAVQHIHRKQGGELLSDRTLFEDLEAGRDGGRRSKVLATVLAGFPGAGQMYLGLQKRGLQLMLLFLGSIYVVDLLRLSALFFLIPVIWFYSLFDALQQISRYGREDMEDRSIIEGFMNHQGWLGALLLCMGLYYIIAELAIPALDGLFPQWRLEHRFNAYFKPIILALVLIGGGIKLLLGNKKRTQKRSNR